MRVPGTRGFPEEEALAGADIRPGLVEVFADNRQVAIAQHVTKQPRTHAAAQRHFADVVGLRRDIDVVADIGNERELLFVDLDVDLARVVRKRFRALGEIAVIDSVFHV